MTCSDLQSRYNQIKSFKSQYDAAFSSRNLPQVRLLHQALEKQRQALIDQIWPFDKLFFSREIFHKQYQNIIDGYRELNLITEKYSLPTEKEIPSALRKNQDFYREKFVTLENPRIHITPFFLSPRELSDVYAKQIEAHFVESKTERGKRIPDPQRTKLFGSDGTPLALRADPENVYFSDELDNLSYFPEWQVERGGAITPKGGLTKDQALKQQGPFRILILEDIPLAPEASQGKTLEKDIKIKSETKKVTRKQVAGGLNAAKQYQALTNLQEEGLTPEDYLSYALLHLRETNQVLDDDRNTFYCARLLGSATAYGQVPIAYWDRRACQARLDQLGSGRSSPDFCARGAVRVSLKT